MLFDFAFLGQLRNQRLVLHIVHIGFDLGSATIGDGLLQTLLRGIDGAFLLVVEVHHHEVRVAGRYQFLHHSVDSLQRNHRSHLLHRRIGIVDAGDGELVEEVLHILVHELTIETLVLVRVLLLEIAQVVSLEASIFRSGESELSGTTGLCDGGRHGSLQLSVLRQDTKFEGVHRLREQIVAVAG